MDPLAVSLVRSPELFPLDVDQARDQVTLIRLTEADYRQASFLDARILGPQTIRRTVAWPQLEAAVTEARLEETVSYIFHIGHVGSTLLSRLLGTHPQVFALREPAILRTLAQIRFQPGAVPLWNEQEFGRRFGVILKLLARTIRTDQRAIVKVTSFVSELGAQMLAQPSRPKAVLMFVPAETYLATILGAPNSPAEARLLAESRLRRLHARIGQERWKLAELGEEEMVAMSWACEMTALAAAADEASDRVLWLNFNRLLETLATSLLSAFRRYGIDPTPVEIESIVCGPELQRYAKAPEYAYGSNLRNEILNQARKDKAGEIARGLSWLDRAAKESSSIESILALR